MNKERIEEVAKKLCDYRDYNDCDSVYIQRFLATLPEFQEPRSSWLEWGDALTYRYCEVDGRNEKALFEFVDGERKYATYEEINTYKVISKVMPIPPYVAPESELVMRYSDKLASIGVEFRMTGTQAIQLLREVEKEMKAEK